MKRALVILVVVSAGLLTACLGAPPPAPPANTKGFDACAAPSTSTMSAWKASSPYSIIGIYIGGANRGCAQPNLTRAWVNTVWGQGWNLMPIWVGPQASCTNLSRTTKLPADPAGAFWQGIAEAQFAANAADALGFGWLTGIYYDMEAYPAGGSCAESIAGFTDGWKYQLHQRGYQAGMYSSLCSGIVDHAAAVRSGQHAALDAIWIAAWNDKPTLFGFGAPCALDDGMWSNHQRIHQYSGGHNESYGGVTMNIDSNVVDAPLAY
jgi:hypothetical protein